MADFGKFGMRKMARLYQQSRERKLELFFQLMNLRPGDRILDIGASPMNAMSFENMLERKYAEEFSIVALTLVDARPLKRAFPAVHCVQGDGCCLPFADGSFDTVYSNAVIEHVGSRAAQQNFVREIVRVGKSGFITTPNFWFPIEQHMTLPFLHFLPWGLRRHLIRIAANERRVEYMRQVRLLSSNDFRSLFPDSVRVDIAKMRTTFWPEQLVAYFFHK